MSAPCVSPSLYFCDEVRCLVPTLRPRHRAHLFLTGKCGFSTAPHPAGTFVPPWSRPSPPRQLPPLPLPFFPGFFLPRSDHPGTLPSLYKPQPSLLPAPPRCLLDSGFLPHPRFRAFPSFLATVCFTFFPFASTGCELQPSYNHRNFGAFWSRLQSSSDSDFQIRIIPSASLTDSDTNQPVTPTRPPNSPSFTCPPSVAWSNCCVLSHDTPPFHSFLALSCWPSFRTFALLPNNTA
jgi:hypothetical protein